jgi:hypothetical protein
VAGLALAAAANASRASSLSVRGILVLDLARQSDCALG